jgi:hypothetical protein
MSNEYMMYIREFNTRIINGIEYAITTSGIHKHKSTMTLNGIAAIV